MKERLASIVRWLIENREWVFSGIGVAVITGAVTVVFSVFHKRHPHKLELSQFSTSNSDVSRSTSMQVEEELHHSPTAKAREYLEKAHKAVSSNPKLHDKQIGTKFIETELPQKIIRMPKKQRLYKAVLFIDVDDLTVINKTYGQDVGNTVLLIVGSFIHNRAAVDYSGRCGDDTFYGVLFKADYKKTEDLCEKIRKQVEQFPWNQVVTGLHVTCAIGFSLLEYDESPCDWIERCAHGMLEAKKQGGNRTSPGPMWNSSPKNHYIGARHGAKRRQYYGRPEPRRENPFSRRKKVQDMLIRHHEEEKEQLRIRELRLRDLFS